MDGILNIYKEAGFTSHDVVARLRGILQQKKIGHTGTLDPDAVGVLPVCCGKATKVCELLTDHDKTYVAVCQLGIETDTQDTSGKVLVRRSCEGMQQSGSYGRQRSLSVTSCRFHRCIRPSKYTERNCMSWLARERPWSARRVR